LRRQNVFIYVLVTFLVITALAGVLGWSSHHTIARVYDEAVVLLASTGQQAPPNPFVLKPILSPLSNMVVYVPLIGALLALVLGHSSIVDDDAGGVGRLIFSRQVTRTSYILGKIACLAAVLAVILCIGQAVSAISLLIINRSMPGPADLGRLSLFYGLSWLYLMLFALIGMLAVLTAGRRSLALLYALGAWLVITFVLPQFTSGLRPTQSLNPTTDPISTSQTFFKVTAHARSYSPVEQYKAASGRILNISPGEPTSETLARVAPILGAVVVLSLLALHLVQRHDFSRGATDE
jgi:ABC-type transport system involved in multi-copper enzyme maturation permease subunit